MLLNGKYHANSFIESFFGCVIESLQSRLSTSRGIRQEQLNAMSVAFIPSCKDARIFFGIMRQSAMCCGINFQYVVLSKAAKISPAARPLLLLLDGHFSHYNPAVIRKAAQEKVILFCLPPHSSHETQPLDKGHLPLSKYTGERFAISL